MKKKILTYLILLSIGIIITYPSFPPSHALDSYCTICNGYSQTATWFLQNGRVISYIFYKLFALIKLPYHSLGYISSLLSTMILAYTIMRLWEELKNNCNFSNKLYNYLLLASILLLFYNPLYTSILVLDEAFIINLGTMLVVLSSIYLFRNNLKSYFLSTLFIILGILCYQGIASYYIITTLLLIISNSKTKNNLKSIINRLIIVIINYGIAFTCNLLIIKTVNKLLNTNISKIGNYNVIKNIEKIYTDLLPTALKYLFRYTNVKYYYYIVFALIIISIINIIKNKDKVISIIYLILLILSSILVPFIPNIFMNINCNYTDARMTLTLGVIPAIIVLFIIIKYNQNIKSIYTISILTIMFFILSFYSIHQNMMIDLKRYRADIKYLNQITNNIKTYEKENNIKVNKIYYAYDSDSAYYYKYGNNNGANIRVSAVDWAFECALKSQIDNNVTMKKLEYSEKDNLFMTNNYDKFNENELVYKNDTLYILIY